MITYTNTEILCMPCDICGGPSEWLEAEVGTSIATCDDCASIEHLDDPYFV